MKNITFGYLLDKLLYLSKQKKSALAKALGYDISYLSKWTSGKNLPVSKNIHDICSTTSEFIVNSLTEETLSDIKQYFEIDKDINNKEYLINYLEELLKEAYAYTTQKSIPIQQKNIYWDEDYNCTIHINPKLRKYYLDKDLELFISKFNKLDLIISANLNKIGNEDKISIANMKLGLSNRNKNFDSRVRVLLGFDGDCDDIIFNTFMIINMIAIYPSMNFEIYNCEVESNSSILIVKDSVLHTANFTKDKRCLISTISKDKRIIEEIYYSVETILNSKGSLLVEKKSLTDIIKEKLYIQYFMNQDLRWLIGSMNELFMPPELFMNISEALFDDPETLEELSKVNIVLQNITYKSKIKVLIYVSEIKKYMSSGKLNFFNTQIELTLDQRKEHINYFKDIIRNSNNIEIKLIDGDFVEYFKYYKNPSLYLSKNIKLIQTDYENGISDYAIIKDQEFKSNCDEFYKAIWEEREIIISDKDEILDILEKELTYVLILNENLSKKR